MPFTLSQAEKAVPGIKVLPTKAKNIWVGAFNGAKSQGNDDSSAASIAWAQVKKSGWVKSGDKWIKKNEDASPIYVVSDDDGNMALGIPFTRVNVKDRTVEGFATLDNIDKSGEIVDYDASVEAFKNWVGNIREMHAPKAVGKALIVEPREIEKNGRKYKGIWVRSRISKGAQDTWEKCLDGTYTGYSIGGKVLQKVPEFAKGDGEMFDAQHAVRITKYHLGELSLVDNPMNPLASFDDVNKILKSEGEALIPGDLIVEEKSLFYCPQCDVAKVDDAEVSTTECVSCDNMMNFVSFVNEAPSVSELHKMVGEFNEMKKTLTAEQYNANGNQQNSEVDIDMQALPQITITDVNDENNTLSEETNAVSGVPVITGKLNDDVVPSLGTQKTEDYDELTAKIAAKVMEVLKGSAEFTGEQQKFKDEEIALFESVMDSDMFKATGDRKSPPKGYPKDKSEYADPENYKYPVDADHVKAAVAYFNHSGQRTAGGYSMAKWAEIGRKIAKSANAHLGEGYSYENGKITIKKMEIPLFEKASAIISLQKNNSDVNTNIVSVLQQLLLLVNPTQKMEKISDTKGGETLDTKELLQKILDIFQTAQSEIDDVAKGFGVERVNSEDGTSATVGGGASEKVLGTPESGSNTLGVKDTTVAEAVSLPSNGTGDPNPKVIPDNGNRTLVPEGGGAGPEVLEPNRTIPSSGSRDLFNADGASDLVKAFEGVMTKFGETIDARLTAVEQAGGGKKSSDVGDEKIEKNDEFSWGGAFGSNLISNSQTE